MLAAGVICFGALGAIMSWNLLGASWGRKTNSSPSFCSFTAASCCALVVSNWDCRPFCFITGAMRLAVALYGAMVLMTRMARSTVLPHDASRVLLASSLDGNLYALDESDGSLLWTLALDPLVFSQSLQKRSFSAAPSSGTGVIAAEAPPKAWLVEPTGPGHLYLQPIKGPLQVRRR
jgi:hypothetical protein